MPETRSETLKTCAALAWWCWLMMIRILTSWWWCWYLQTDLSSRWLDVRRLLAAEAWLSGPGGELPATSDTSTSYPPSFESDGELQRCKDVVACTCMYLHVRKYIEYNTCSEMWCDGETEKSPIVQTYYFFIGIGVICKYLVPRLLVFNTQYFYISIIGMKKNMKTSISMFAVATIVSFSLYNWWVLCTVRYRCCFFKVDVTFFLNYQYQLRGKQTTSPEFLFPRKVN